MSKNIILVDKRVQDYETIVAAIDPDLAIGIVFDYFEDTFDTIKARIDVLGNTSGNTAGISVGLVQHNYRSPMFGMVASADLAPVANIAAHDPDLMLWAEFRDFIMWCKTERGGAHFDLMACALYSDNDWKYVIDTLTLQTGVTIRASTDDTGAASQGGDWFLESHTGVNMKDVYFTEAIEEYRGVFTVSKGDPILAFVSPPTSKNMSEIFTVTATSASSGAVTYTSSNTSLATVGLSTGLVSLKSVGTVTITAAQALSALYNAPINTTCSIVISAAGSALAGQTVSPGSSYADVDFSGAILTGSTLSGVSFSGASLINTDFSGATITGANFTNANISGASLINADFSGAVITGTEFTNANINGATNLPVFSTVQKLQLLKNINNIAVDAIQINTQVSGADINAMLPISVFAIASATFTVKAPSGLDASSNKIVTITDADISNNTSVYVPLNANETVKINGTVFSFNGTNLFDVSNNPIPYLTVEGVPFRIYAGSVIALNMSESLNEVKIMGDGVYNIIAELFASK